MKKLIIAATSLVILVWACKKDENTTTDSLELSPYNIAGTYKTTNATFTAKGSSASISLYAIDSLYPTCKKDDLLIFDTLSTYTEKDAGDSCTTPPKTTSGNYALALPNILNYKSVSFLIEKLTKTELVIVKDTIFKFNVLPTDTVPSTFDGRLKLYLKRQ
jgi:hypothetical protein